MGCCPPKGIRKIRVGDCVAGVTGLDALFDKLLRQGWSPEQNGLRQELVAGLRAAGNYIEPGEEALYADAVAELYRDYFTSAQERNLPPRQAPQGENMKIEILGPGCARCRATEEAVRQALAELSLGAEIVHITDVLEISKRRVLLTPGVVIDGQVLSSGRVPEREEVKKWLAARLSTTSQD